MKAANRPRIAIEVDGSIFTIRGYRAHALALGAGIRPTYNGVRAAWVADTKRLPDLVSYLEYRNVPVNVEIVQRVGQLVTAVTNPDEEELFTAVNSSAPEYPTLFDGSR